MVKKIELTKGMYALVDDEDYPELSKYSWCASKSTTEYYAYRKERRGGKQKTLYMHRVILDAPKGHVVDHINHNTLDNRRCNIRLCTYSQNAYNQLDKRSRKYSKYKGVTISRNRKGYSSEISANKKKKFLGTFKTEREAALAYQDAAKKLHGEFACLG